MASKSENSLSHALRAVLAELPIGGSFAELETRAVHDFLLRFEWFLPEVFGDIHPDWLENAGLNADATDGISLIVARKTRDREAEIFGVCHLLPLSETVPIQARLQIAPHDDEVTWIELRLGERGEDGKAKFLEHSPKRLYLLDGHYEQINWFYEVTFGERSQA